MLFDDLFHNLIRIPDEPGSVIDEELGVDRRVSGRTRPAEQMGDVQSLHDNLEIRIPKFCSKPVQHSIAMLC